MFKFQNSSQLWKFQVFYLSFSNLEHSNGISKKLNPRLGTFGGTWDPRHGTWDPGPSRWDPRSENRDPTHRWDLRSEILRVDFQQIFSVFFEAWRLWMNSPALCVYVYFVCFLLPYHKAYTFSIFYHLNELLFSSFCKLLPCICYEIFKFVTKPMIIVRPHIKNSEKYLNRWK